LPQTAPSKIEKHCSVDTMKKYRVFHLRNSFQKQSCCSLEY